VLTKKIEILNPREAPGEGKSDPNTKFVFFNISLIPSKIYGAIAANRQASNGPAFLRSVMFRKCFL